MCLFSFNIFKIVTIVYSILNFFYHLTYLEDCIQLLSCIAFSGFFRVNSSQRRPPFDVPPIDNSVSFKIATQLHNPSFATFSGQSQFSQQ